MLIAARRSWFGERTTSIFLFFVVAAVVILGLFLLTSAPYIRYRFSRLFIMLHPESDPGGFGYIPTVIHNALEHSTFLGHGTPLELGDGMTGSLAQFLPAFHTDFILTYITYTFGWVVSGVLVALLTIFFVFGFRKCLKQKSVLGKMISLSILTTLAAETLFYVSANLGYIFAGPIALPFLSYGGATFIINLGLVGILLSTFRTGEVYLDTTESPAATGEPEPFISWNDGRLIISFRR